MRQNPAAAIPLLKDVVAAEPANGNARFQLGAALAKLGDCAKCPPAPRPRHAQRAEATTCSRPATPSSTALDDAQRERARAAKEFRTGADALVQAKFRAAVAQKKAAAGQLNEAIADYRAAMALAPDLSLKIDLAVALLKHNDAAAVKALLAGESDPVARYQLALAEAKPEARALLEAVVRDKPGFVEAWYQLGVTLMALDQPQDAERAFAQAVALRADEPALRRAWAESLHRSGRTAEAAEQRRLSR
jgi:tetratricopeptide (TPR) repeat protein